MQFNLITLSKLKGIVCKEEQRGLLALTHYSSWLFVNRVGPH